MVYLRANKKWYKTKFTNFQDISIMAYDYIEVMYNDLIGTIDVPKHVEYLKVTDAMKLEIWMQEEIHFFNEKKFNNLIEHFERTGQKVITTYGKN